MIERYGICGGDAMKRIKLKLSGLACAGCINAVKNALEKVGAKVEDINLNEAKIVIEDDNVERYIEAIREIGYDAELED